MSQPLLIEPVGEYRPKLSPTKYVTGVAATIKFFYERYLQDEYGAVVFETRTITTTPQVLAVLKAVLCAGTCRSEERAAACRMVFNNICASRSYIGTDEVLASFVESSDNVFVKEIQDTIRGLLC